MERLNGKELATVLTDFVNSSDKEKQDEFIEYFSRQHRTLQQSAFGMFLKLLEHVASDDYNTDDRNEDSKKVAQTMLKGFKTAQIQNYVDEGISEERAKSYVSGDGAKPSKYLGSI